MKNDYTEIIPPADGDVFLSKYGAVVTSIETLKRCLLNMDTFRWDIYEELLKAERKLDKLYADEES